MPLLKFDGGMGWQLPQYAPYGSLQSNELHPQQVIELHRSFAQAGADLLCTNTFCLPLALHQGHPKALDWARQAVDLALEARTTQALFLSLGPAPLPDDLHHLKTGLSPILDSLDGVILETQCSIPDALGWVRFLHEAGVKRLVLSFMPQPYFAQPGGARPFAEEVALTFQNLVDGLGLNCGNGDALTEGLKELWATCDLPLLARPNRGVPKNGVYPLNSEDFSDELVACLQFGATLIGGCCGVDAHTLGQAYRHLDA